MISSGSSGSNWAVKQGAEQEIRGKHSEGKISGSLKIVEERVIKRIYQEDQKEIDGLQTATQKREKVHKLVQEFVLAQEMETREITAPKYENIQGNVLNNIRCGFLEHKNGEKDEKFKLMMLKKFADYDKIMLSNQTIS